VQSLYEAIKFQLIILVLQTNVLVLGADDLHCFRNRIMEMVGSDKEANGTIEKRPVPSKSVVREINGLKSYKLVEDENSSVGN